MIDMAEGDFILIGDTNHGGPNAVGIISSGGMGIGEGEEFHVQWGNTTTLYSINLFDIWDNI